MVRHRWFTAVPHARSYLSTSRFRRLRRRAARRAHYTVLTLPYAGRHYGLRFYLAPSPAWRERVLVFYRALVRGMRKYFCCVRLCCCCGGTFHGGTTCAVRFCYCRFVCAATLISYDADILRPLLRAFCVRTTWRMHLFPFRVGSFSSGFSCISLHIRLCALRAYINTYAHTPSTGSFVRLWFQFFIPGFTFGFSTTYILLLPPHTACALPPIF